MNVPTSPPGLSFAVPPQSAFGTVCCGRSVARALTSGTRFSRGREPVRPHVRLAEARAEDVAVRRPRPVRRALARFRRERAHADRAARTDRRDRLGEGSVRVALISARITSAPTVAAHRAHRPTACVAVIPPRHPAPRRLASPPKGSPWRSLPPASVPPARRRRPSRRPRRPWWRCRAGSCPAPRWRTTSCWR